MPKIWILWLTLLVAVYTYPVSASSDQADFKPTPQAISTIRFLLEQKHVDLARAELTNDHLIDPSLDVNAILQRTYQMATEIRWSFRPGMTDIVDCQNSLYIYL